MTIGKSEDDYDDDADDCFDVNESGGRDLDRRLRRVRYFHPKERSFPVKAALHPFRSGAEERRDGDMLGFHRKEARQEGIWPGPIYPAMQPCQPWHVLLKDGGVFELDPFDEIGAPNRDGRISFV